MGLGVLHGQEQVQKGVPRHQAPVAGPLAAWAYWSPPKPFELEPSYLLVGYFAVSFCFTTPVVLTLMALYYPDVNKPVMRLTAFLGLVYGLYNVVPPLVLLALGTYIPEAIWRGTILHLPLLITGVYALGLTIRAPHHTSSSPKHQKPARPPAAINGP